MDRWRLGLERRKIRLAGRSLGPPPGGPHLGERQLGAYLPRIPLEQRPLALIYTLHTTCRPNGISDNSISFRCCRANGMPMIVIHNNAAKTRCTTAVYRPPQINQ